MDLGEVIYTSASKRDNGIMRQNFRSILGDMKGRSKEKQSSWRIFLGAKQDSAAGLAPCANSKHRSCSANTSAGPQKEDRETLVRQQLVSKEKE